MRAIACATVLAATLVLASAAHAAFPGANGKIAYTILDDSELHDLLTIDPATGAKAGPFVMSIDYFVATWSPDGRFLAYDEDGILRTRDMTSGQVSTLVSSAFDPAWSPDGTQLTYVGSGGLRAISKEGTGDHLVFSASTALEDPAWSPDGTKIAFTRWVSNYTTPELDTVQPDGNSLTPISTGLDANWSPDGSKLAVTGSDGVRVMNANGSGSTLVTSGREPAWSPDGTRIAFTNAGNLLTMKPDGTSVTPLDTVDFSSDPDWQPIPINAYPRPKGATPTVVTLVPAFVQCSALNRTHGAPLAFGSCAPPAQTSTQLTVGTPDANGKPAKSTGFASLATKVGNPATPADEADVRLQVRITDVRDAGDLSDYSGSLEARPTLRITDRDNSPSPGGPGAGTVTDVAFPFAVACSVTLDATVGSTCSVVTTADTVVPGSVKEGKRAIWALGAFEVHDGSGAAFMRQGVFVP